MHNFMKRTLICFISVFCLIGILSKIDVRAAEQQTLDEAQNVANARYHTMIELIKDKSQEFGLSLKDLQDTCLGMPFIILDEDREKQDEIYYFPVLTRENNPVLVLSIMGTDRGWRAAMDTEYVEMLEALDYTVDSQFIFHKYDNGYLVEEGSERCWVSCQDDQYNVQQINSLPYAVSRNDLEPYLNPYLDRFVKVQINEVSSHGDRLLGLPYSPAFSTNTDTAKIMLLYNKQGQEGENLCWAASAATTINYSYGQNNTAKEIADSLGIAYSTGGNKYDIQNALHKYHLAYHYVQNNQLSFDSVKKNVGDRHPVIVCASASGLTTGHAVTLYGYGSNYVYLWNPGNCKTHFVEYLADGTVFPYGEHVYVWDVSVSFYE